MPFIVCLHCNCYRAAKQVRILIASNTSGHGTSLAKLINDLKKYFYAEKDWLKMVNAGGEGQPFTVGSGVSRPISGIKRSSSKNGESDDETGVPSKTPAPPINDIYRSRQQKRVK